MKTGNFFLLLFIGFILIYCEREEPRFSFDDLGREVPAFNADSAYKFISDQVDFGPRNPGSEAHIQAKEYIRERLADYSAGNVFVQEFTAEGYDEELQMYNIIAAFNPGSTDRVLLAAHWDTRPRAEEDPFNPDQPIPGADDGGSGVGVLLELARIMSRQQPQVGVDIIFFDGEDYGRSGDLQKYFLGARHWTENPPVEGYSPRFGILLDMVGGENALFPKEGYSLEYAPSLVNAVWDVANDIGYSEFFPDREGAMISDDHLIVNRNTNIRMINIIHHRRAENGSAQFPPYWHTQNDNIEIIDKSTLQAVGDLITQLIYNRIE